LEFEFIRFTAFFVLSISIFTSVILVIKGSVWPLNNRLMGFIFLISNTYIIVTILIFSGGIMRIPHLFRAFAPLYYLIGPLLYFYFQGALFSERISLKRDWFHFLPALIHFIDLIPFYLTSSVEKKAMLAQIEMDPSKINIVGTGLIGSDIHATIRLTLLIAYLSYIFICLVKSRNIIWNQYNGKALFRLLILVIVVFALGGLTNGILLVDSFVGTSLNTSFASNGSLFYLTLASFVSMLFLHGFIFFMPENIFNLSDPSNLKRFQNIRQRLDKQEIIPTIPTETESKDEILSKLELGLKFENWFKIKGLTIEECAQKLNCEKYILSKLINGHYKMRFNDLINMHRVEFVKSEIKKGSTKNITLEGLADEAGFNSRTTFYNAFIKHEGISPLEFLKSTLK
jgi:AraC-like DNA-binding protein